MAFVDTVAAGLAAGRHLCVGVDPHAHLLAEWQLADSADGAERMGRQVVAAAAGRALTIKPQIALFERFGAAGYRALERVLGDARDAGLPVIADVKRGDIGTSFQAYAEAWLAPGAPLESDAMTVAAYQGFDSIATALALAAHHRKAVFVLAATSNPEARGVQLARLEDGRTVARSMLDAADAWNREHCAADPLGTVGVVLGATVRLADFGIDAGEAARSAAVPLPVLAPGFGAQGATVADARTGFGALTPTLIVNESRSLLAGGGSNLADRIAERAHDIREALR